MANRILLIMKFKYCVIIIKRKTIELSMQFINAKIWLQFSVATFVNQYKGLTNETDSHHVSLPGYSSFRFCTRELWGSGTGCAIGLHQFSRRIYLLWVEMFRDIIFVALSLTTRLFANCETLMFGHISRVADTEASLSKSGVAWREDEALLTARNGTTCNKIHQI